MADNLVNKAIYAICAVIVLTVLCLCLPDPYLWYDEAGQFWISQGLNHYSDPNAAVGSVQDVLINNRGYNMDPGGFSVALFFWQGISTNWFFLRMLPAFFFIGFTFCIYRVTKKEIGNQYYALLIATLFYILPIFTGRVAELRGYPMELLGTALSLLLLLNFKNRLSYKALIILSIIQVIFCTSRYGYIIVAFCVSIRVMYLLYMQNTLWFFIKKIMLYSTPLLLAIILIYWEMMRFQSSEGAEISYVGYISTNPKLLLSPMSICFYVLFAILIYDYRKNKVINEINLFTFLVSGVYFVLSIVGLYPWDMHRTISAFFLLVLSIFLGCLRIILTFKPMKFFSLCGLSICFLLFLFFFGKIHIKETDKQINEFVSFVENTKFEKMLVQVHMSPVIRYQYEYGLLKARSSNDGYPYKFLFQKGLPHNMHTSDAPLPQDKYDVVWSTAADVIPLGCHLIQGYTNFYRYDNH